MPTPITQKGFDALKAELDRLRKVERPKNIEAIAEARAHGDLSENAEYDAAKERQGFIAARMAELETKIAEARVVDTTGRTTETAVFGATVLVIEQSLKIIDAAVRQSRAALARDPNSGFLADQLNHALDKKVELLRTVALLPSRT